VADRATTFARHLLAAARRRRPPFALCYHGIGHESAPDDPHGLFVTPERFAAHLDVLIAAGYRLVGIEELWAAVAAGKGDGLGAITFDDGLADSTHTAFELLAARDATATVFLAPGLLDGDHPDMAPGRRILRSDEVAPLARAGLTIGAHSAGHVDLAALGADAVRAELRHSREQLEALVGAPVTTMAYPFGSYTAETAGLAREAGVRVACACAGAGPWHPLALPREGVLASTTARRTRLKAAGLYGPVQALAETRNRLASHGA